MNLLLKTPLRESNDIPHRRSTPTPRVGADDVTFRMSLAREMACEEREG